MVNINTLRFGSKFKHKGEVYFVTDVMKRVIRVRKVFNITKDNLHGSLSNVVQSIPIKELKTNKTPQGR